MVAPFALHTSAPTSSGGLPYVTVTSPSDQSQLLPDAFSPQLFTPLAPHSVGTDFPSGLPPRWTSYPLPSNIGFHGLMVPILLGTSQSLQRAFYLTL